MRLWRAITASLVGVPGSCGTCASGGAIFGLSVDAGSLSPRPPAARHSRLAQQAGLHLRSGLPTRAPIGAQKDARRRRAVRRSPLIVAPWPIQLAERLPIPGPQYITAPPAAQCARSGARGGIPRLTASRRCPREPSPAAEQPRTKRGRSRG